VIEVADVFRRFADAYLAAHGAAMLSHDEVKRVLEREVLPAWRHRRIGEITRREIFELIDGIAERGAVTAARRCHAYLHRLFRWSAGGRIIEMSPMAYLPKPGAEVKRKRVLSNEELRLVWAAAQQIGWPMGSAIQLLILTCARRDEIGALQWREVNKARNEIHLEGEERTKNGEDHTIPLSEAALELLDAVPRVAGSPFVFTTTGNTPISGWSRAKENIDKIMRAQLDDFKPWRIHDLRRTVATGMERLGIQQQVVEALLGHIAGSKAGVVGIYQRYAYEQEKRAALEKWAEYIASLVGRAK
jgi:integrase